MPLHIFGLTTLALFLCAALGNPAHAQNDPPVRGMPSDDFANSRPEPTANAAATKQQPPAAKAPRGKISASMRRRERYKAARIEPQAFQSSLTGKSPVNANPNQTLRVEELGVTFWRLRPPLATDKGPKVVVKTDDNRREWWTPTRVGADTQFRKGDRVRLTFEAKRRGYLYVMNAEMYANGALGKLYLIFPAPANQDGKGRLLAAQFNQVGAGLLVDIPDQAEDYPYFKIEPRGANYTGELLLLIISPTPLEGLRLGPDQEVVNVDFVARLEATLGGEISLYVKEGSEQETLTAAEQQAQCGAKSRQLVRETSSSQNSALSPCGAKKRQLTREDPLPQNIYRVATPQEGMLIVPVRIAVNMH